MNLVKYEGPVRAPDTLLRGQAKKTYPWESAKREPMEQSWDIKTLLYLLFFEQFCFQRYTFYISECFQGKSFIGSVQELDIFGKIDLHNYYTQSFFSFYFLETLPCMVDILTYICEYNLPWVSIFWSLLDYLKFEHRVANFIPYL
ncbi:hypothetical protein PHYBLDRAFT_67415 [Phycomyces blakesleeanus NRRL 1555(-)]|uniref:Uncharacterized protein n=1 Tax=Phycomyces blakesleeanus (strain ATCC 8743b / DSM 1359 / FGSC 10004 / NBRC 33097 / NRRL 1555) TaxID=763407 RepID=A0A162N7L4_PHYB8|nr:hypothetical protein PHYBLDRAFT_67415 [Phycomyces blakesleeanus NRRL 1555(-)]OAD66534.1 hypothetical protein PHYBLDRAFT_67415 [Phycomyces blakesleeanus NRRL 1555(-)]|eukprot:XP_018284574.1 hypothetical protein PHYBLDRAFT_67415 [Phycomyces blakesleeanus NRRL 1555(-)]